MKRRANFRTVALSWTHRTLASLRDGVVAALAEKAPSSREGVAFIMGPRRRTSGTWEEGAAKKKAARRHRLHNNNCI